MPRPTLNSGCARTKTVEVGQPSSTFIGQFDRPAEINLSPTDRTDTSSYKQSTDSLRLKMALGKRKFDGDLVYTISDNESVGDEEKECVNPWFVARKPTNQTADTIPTTTSTRTLNGKKTRAQSWTTRAGDLRGQSRPYTGVGRRMQTSLRTSTTSCENDERRG